MPAPPGELPATELREGELRLRPPRRDEAALYARWWSDPETRWGFCSSPRTAAEIAGALPELEAEARDAGFWTELVLEVDGRPAGSLWISRWDLDAGTAELNILIGEPDLRRHGIGRRAVRLFAAWAFRTMGLARLDLCPRDDHLPAIRSYRAAGAHPNGTCEEVSEWEGQPVCFARLSFYAADFAAGAG